MIPKPADHPPSCRVCKGSGWQDGPPIHSLANGDQVTYTTVEPCRHHWTNDDASKENA
jgi:hypothetical protein